MRPPRAPLLLCGEGSEPHRFLPATKWIKAREQTRKINVGAFQAEPLR